MMCAVGEWLIVRAFAVLAGVLIPDASDDVWAEYADGER